MRAQSSPEAELCDPESGCQRQPLSSYATLVNLITTLCLSCLTEKARIKNSIHFGDGAKFQLHNLQRALSAKPARCHGSTCQQSLSLAADELA